VSEYPRYQSHKIVRAVKLAAAEWHEDGGITVQPKAGPELYASVKFEAADAGRFAKLSEEDLGYLVQYEDGYQSWSPSKAFEEGYFPIDKAES
jgi:hypothetical protein